MATIVQETRIELAGRELLALDRIEGHLLACASGELWITLDGSREDIILGPGQSWRVPRGDPVVVSALKPSVLIARHPQGEAPHGLPRGRSEWLRTARARWTLRQPFAGLPVTLLR